MKLLRIAVVCCTIWAAATAIPANRSLSSVDQSLLASIMSSSAIDPSSFQNRDSSLFCWGCTFIMNKVIKFISEGIVGEKIRQLVVRECINFHIEDTTVCKAIVSEYGDVMFYVVGNMLLGPETICGLIDSRCRSESEIPPDGAWRVPLPNVTKPERRRPVLPSPDKPKARVLHLSDLHYDKNYTIGSEADCGEPICCRDTKKTRVIKPALKWGTGAKCDIPLRTIENLFEHLAARNDFDYIIWTGDLPPHNVWSQCRDDQLEVLNTLTKLVKHYFPNKPFLSAVGNHESNPSDNFPPNALDNLPERFSISWLYDALADQWTQFGIGHDAETVKSIKSIGSYVFKPLSGLRVISLNVGYCLQTNFLAYLDMYDPSGVLGWLIKQLQSAEDDGDSVHIIAHVPPGGVSCMKQWALNFYDIIDRYENTVTGMFFGHTHFDEFQVYYHGSNVSMPNHVAYVAPSVTTESFNWPSFRIYTIDGDYNESSYRVLDHETYVMNLDEANESDKPEWKLEYRAMEEYNMTSLLPEEWDRLILKLAADKSLFAKYYGYRFRSPYERSCDLECRLSLLCHIRQGRAKDDPLCQDLYS